VHAGPFEQDRTDLAQLHQDVLQLMLVVSFTFLFPSRGATWHSRDRDRIQCDYIRTKEIVKTRTPDPELMLRSNLSDRLGGPTLALARPSFSYDGRSFRDRVTQRLD
jgi:hypothetical protein